MGHAAAEVGISKAEAKEALTSPQSAGALLEKITRRFHEGRKRLERALSRMMDLRDAGDLEGARQQIRDWLAVEVVPVYRRAAEENLAGLDELPPALGLPRFTGHRSYAANSLGRTERSYSTGLK